MSEKILPIVMDLETSGLHPNNNGIWQIGAVDLSNPEKVFSDESSIDDEDLVEEEALKVIGKTEDELRNPNKQSQKEMIEKFLSWVEVRPFRCFLCQNPQFDIGFLWNKAKKYGLKKTFNYRAFDLHSIAQTKYFEVHGKLLTRDDGSSDMNLTSILEFCGMPDKRIKVNNGEVAEEGNPHNALEDARLTGECFYRLMFGENLFEEYKKYEIPKYLKKDSAEDQNEH